MIRNALPTDAEAIAQVHVSSWQEAYRDLIPADYLDSLGATLARREDYWNRAIEAGEPCVFVAEVNGQIVGWIAVGASRDADGAGGKVGEVLAIYVLAGYWQTGVGLALWTAGVQWLVGQGYERLTLWVLTGNERAIRFYRGVGGSEDVGNERSLERGGVPLTEVRYRVPIID